MQSPKLFSLEIFVSKLNVFFAKKAKKLSIDIDF